MYVLPIFRKYISDFVLQNVLPFITLQVEYRISAVGKKALIIPAVRSLNEANVNSTSISKSSTPIEKTNRVWFVI